MRISHVCIERPVLATVLSLVIVLFGLVALARIPNREFPDIDPPVVSVTTVLPGAAPEVVETSVTQPLEDQLIGIEGIKHITSSSTRAGVADHGRVRARPRRRPGRERRARPRRARAEPAARRGRGAAVVAKRDADASPIMWLALYGGGYDQIELSTLAETQLQDRLGKLPGVSEVLIAGEQRFSMRVWIDNDAADAPRPHGRRRRGGAAARERRHPVGPRRGRRPRVHRADARRAAHARGLRRARRRAARAASRCACATSRASRSAPRTSASSSASTASPPSALGIVKQSKANTLDVARAVKAEVERLRPLVPPGVTFDNAFDSSIFIERSLADVRETICRVDPPGGHRHLPLPALASARRSSRRSRSRCRSSARSRCSTSSASRSTR